MSTTENCRRNRDNYGAVPLAAIVDQRLAPADKDLLCVIAWHGRGGNGCYAGHKTLAAEVELSIGTVANSISRLIECGHLESVVDPDDARLRRYFVIYGPPPAWAKKKRMQGADAT